MIARNIFINCPFSDDYKTFFDAIVFSVMRCGFIARCALEADDGTENRLDKIVKIIRECPYGIHDISMTKLNDAGLPRFNMPFELGLFIGAKKLGAQEQQQKKCIILDCEPYRYQQFISDIAGHDIHAHGDKVDVLIEKIATRHVSHKFPVGGKSPRSSRFSRKCSPT
jgi:hypothetical protein